MVIGLVAAGVWVSLMVIAVALCRIAAQADGASAGAFTDAIVVRAELRRRASTHPASRGSAPRTALFPH